MKHCGDWDLYRRCAGKCAQLDFEKLIERMQDSASPR